MNLKPRQIHVWKIPLSLPVGEISKHTGCLSTEEKARMDLFVDPMDRQNYVLSHAGMRTVLARYLQRTPESIVFKYSDFGRPVLKDSSLNFNLSHSGAIAVCAIGFAKNIGIDIELKRAIEHNQEIVQRYFTRRESEGYQLLKPEERLEAFFRMVTKKEACLKAIGLGLNAPLNSIEVGFQKDKTEIIWHDAKLKDLLPVANVQELPIASDYLCHLAVSESRPLVDIKDSV